MNIRCYFGMFQWSVIGLALVLVTGCAPALQPPPLELTFLPERGEFIGTDGTRLGFHQALNLAAGADYVILGEGHKNQCDHTLQQQVVRGLVEFGRSPAIGLEMVPVTLQPVLDRFNAGEIPPAGLAEALDWQRTWGYPYALFAPLFETAAAQGLPVAGLNTPSATTRKVGREGPDALTDEERAAYPTRVISPLPEQEAELRAMFAMHGDRLGTDEDAETRLGRFLLVQSVWDTMMAEQAVALRERTGRPVVVIAGSGHVDHDYGIPRRVRLLDPGAKVVTLVPLRDPRWYDPDMGSAAFYCPEAYESRMKMTLEERGGRVVVTEVQPGGRAAEAGIRPGDELVRAQGRTVQGLMDLHLAGKRAHDADQPLMLGFDRYGQRVTVNLGKLGQKGKPGQSKPEQADKSMQMGQPDAAAGEAKQTEPEATEQ